MSAYNIHPLSLDYATCNGCSTEAFVWMTEAFACPECGGEEYVYTIESDGCESEVDGEDGSIIVEGWKDAEVESSRMWKRKRVESSSEEEVG
jgi:predicted RNA-binding Zn-ribbon protein involved in translation (DUF1610 family)